MLSGVFETGGAPGTLYSVEKHGLTENWMSQEILDVVKLTTNTNNPIY